MYSEWKEEMNTFLFIDDYGKNSREMATKPCGTNKQNTKVPEHKVNI